MIAAADTALVVVDSSKFGRRALARVAALEEVAGIVTDDGLDQSERDRYGDALVLAG
jgi:DeoR family transcriptional regulator of aga operon